MNRRPGKSWLILFQIFLWILLAFIRSQTANAQKLSDTISIGEVRVVGKHLLKDAAKLTTNIDTLVLQMLRTQTVSELLSTYSPVFIKSYGRGSTATASFRGTAASHTQVYWNGMILNSPMRGDADFSLFPVHFIDDLSLQHGSSSLQSGAGALGGSILLNNRPDWTNRLNIRYMQLIESFSTYKEYLTIGFGTAKLQFKTRIFNDRSENDFPYYNYGVLPMHEAVQKQAGYNKSGLLQEVYSRFGQQAISGRFWIYQSNRDLPQLMSFEGDSRKETQDDINMRAVASWKHMTDKHIIEWSTGINHSELDYFRSSTEANFVNFDSRSTEKSFTNLVSFDWTPKETLNFYWSFNTAYNKVSVFDHARQTGYDEDQLSFSLLNSANILIKPTWALTFLARSEWYDGHLIGFIPALGSELWMDQKKSQSFKAHLSRNYHRPGLNDLYWLPGGNPELKPEDSYTGDLSYSYQGGDAQTSFSTQITGFASVINNWITWQPSANGAYYWEASNLREVFARGVEFQASGKTNIANGLILNLSGNYSYTATSNIDAVKSVDDSRGKQLIYIPKHKANLFVEADFRNYYLKANAPFTGKRYTSSNNVESDYEKILNPYWLVNLTLGKSFLWKDLGADVSLNIENTLNTDYMAILWRPMPGRYYSLTIQIQYRK